MWRAHSVTATPLIPCKKNFHSSMAAKSERVVKKRKPKVDGGTHRKLGIDQKVEVKSVENGLLGSWHLGTVIGCDDLFFQVKYDHVLSDHGSDNLVEFVSVSPIVDGITPADEKSVHHLGMNMIRPLPPPREFARLPLPYGQCVDMFYNDAWWEGVIFDREEGDEERRIYFPDMGDEMKGRVDKMRVSQDWNEVTEEWEPRGFWIFLEVIEEIEQLYPLLISVKQIWYEVQLKDDSKNLKHWTFSSTDIWRKLVKEVVLDNTKLTIKQFFSELNSSTSQGSQFSEFSVVTFEDKLNFETYFDNLNVPFTDSAVTLPIDQNFFNLQSVEKRFVSAPGTKVDQLCGSGDCRSVPPRQNEESSVSPHDFSVIPPHVADDTGILSSTKSDPPALTNSKPRRGRPPTKKKKFEGQTLVSEPDSCLEASVKYMPSMPSDDITGISSSTKSGLPTFANSKCRRMTLPGEPDSCLEAITKLMPFISSTKEFTKHILHLGWKIQLKMECGIIKKCYIAPDGKVCQSLIQVCQMLEE